jgi:hypothetical protein
MGGDCDNGRSQLAVESHRVTSLTSYKRWRSRTFRGADCSRPTGNWNVICQLGREVKRSRIRSRHRLRRTQPPTSAM